MLKSFQFSDVRERYEIFRGCFLEWHGKVRIVILCGPESVVSLP